MHDLLVVLGTITGFLAVVWITHAALDDLEDRANEKRFKALNEFVENGTHLLDHTAIALISAELQHRMSMLGEYRVTSEHRTLLHTIATYIYILVKADVRNQVHLLMVVCEQLNRHSNYTARVNITTTNRLELIVQLGTDERVVYIKLHSINTLF